MVILSRPLSHYIPTKKNRYQAGLITDLGDLLISHEQIIKPGTVISSTKREEGGIT
jgi:hypothetical protein